LSGQQYNNEFLSFKVFRTPHTAQIVYFSVFANGGTKKDLKNVKYAGVSILVFYVM